MLSGNMKSVIFGVLLLCLTRYGWAIQDDDVEYIYIGDEIATLPPEAQINKCSLQTSAGLINLWPIGNKNSGNPRWPYQTTVSTKADPNLYSFDPCYPFTQGTCKSAYVCQSNSAKGNDVSVGLMEGKFIYDEMQEEYMIQYIGDYQQVDQDPVITNVILECQPGDLEDSIQVLGNISNGLYLITLYSHCCCPGGCSSEINPSTSDKLSFGSIMCIMFVCLFFVYLIGGMIYMKAVRGAKGSEIIPNVEFWVDLPNLVMDGVAFIFTCGKANITSSQEDRPTAPGSGSKSTAYDSI